MYAGARRVGRRTQSDAGRDAQSRASHLSRGGVTEGGALAKSPHADRLMRLSTPRGLKVQINSVNSLKKSNRYEVYGMDLCRSQRHSLVNIRSFTRQGDLRRLSNTKRPYSRLQSSAFVLSFRRHSARHLLCATATWKITLVYLQLLGQMDVCLCTGAMQSPAVIRTSVASS